jgi:hypothetical protein
MLGTQSQRRSITVGDEGDCLKDHDVGLVCPVADGVTVVEPAGVHLAVPALHTGLAADRAAMRAVVERDGGNPGRAGRHGSAQEIELLHD